MRGVQVPCDNPTAPHSQQDSQAAVQSILNIQAGQGNQQGLESQGFQPPPLAFPPLADFTHMFGASIPPLPTMPLPQLGAHLELPTAYPAADLPGFPPGLPVLPQMAPAEPQEPESYDWVCSDPDNSASEESDGEGGRRQATDHMPGCFKCEFSEVQAHSHGT